MPVNNSKSNLVNLVYCDHVLAHCYMSLASNSKYYESANIDAIIAILNNNYGERFGFNYTSIEEFVADFDEVKDILKCNHTVSDEQKLKLSEISSNSRWYNNGVNESFTRFKPEGDDWVKGRMPESELAKQHKSEANKGCHWYNDGITSYFTATPKQNWVRGRLDIVGDNNPSKRVDVRIKISTSLSGPRSTSKKCMCIETGQIFDSAKVAAEWLGQKMSVDKACKEPNRTRGGYH